MSRPELGEFSSIICFKAPIAPIEEACLRKNNRDRPHRTTAAVAVKTLPID
jgi:hypothetical protein